MHNIHQPVAFQITPLVFDLLQCFILVGDRLEFDHGEIATLVEHAIFVQHVGNPAAHTGSEVPARMTKHYHTAAGHVFAAMITHSLYHCSAARIAHAKTLTANTREEHFSTNRAVQHSITDNNVIVGLDR